MQLIAATSPNLVKPSLPVDSIETLPALVSTMFEAMKANHGVGLAAPQIGHFVRLAVIEWGGQRLVLVNPTILYYFGKKEVDLEGCLSLPGKLYKVKRFTSIRYQARDQDFNESINASTGYLARIIQHEVDHLNGVLINQHGKSTSSY